MKVKIIIFLFILKPIILCSYYDYRFGLCLDFGTLINRIGISIEGFINNDFIQLNSANKFYIVLNGYETNKLGFEIQSSLGIIFSFGNIYENYINKSFLVFENNTKRQFSIGYIYNIFINNYDTSQTTASLSFEWNQIYFVLDDDFLSFVNTDKFRTGAIGLFYKFLDYQLGIKNINWTGDAQLSPDIFDPNFLSRFKTYKDITKAPYGLTSHGILTFQFQYITLYSQLLQINIGIDSEYIRNFIQNQIFHDMYFIPEYLIEYKNPHIPMLDISNNIYLYKENQKVKECKLFIEFSINPNLFY